jgi:uncharacterized membrane protein YgcG
VFASLAAVSLLLSSLALSPTRTCTHTLSPSLSLSLSLFLIHACILSEYLLCSALCALFTTGVEGVSRNVVAVGMKSGVINVLDACDLSQVARHRKHNSPVSALCLNRTNTQLISGDLKGILLRWTLDMDKNERNDKQSKSESTSTHATGEESADSSEDSSGGGGSGSSSSSSTRPRSSATARLRTLSTLLF